MQLITECLYCVYDQFLVPQNPATDRIDKIGGVTVYNSFSKLVGVTL